MQESSFSPSPESSSSSFSLSVAVCYPQIHKACANLKTNIWLMPLLRDARGWGQQTANPALLTSGREETERRWMEEGREENGDARGERWERWRVTGGWWESELKWRRWRTDDWRGPVGRHGLETGYSSLI